MRKSGISSALHSAEVTSADFAPIRDAGLFASNGHTNGHTTARSAPLSQELIASIPMNRREELRVSIGTTCAGRDVITLTIARPRRGRTVRCFSFSTGLLADLERAIAEARRVLESRTPQGSSAASDIRDRPAPVGGSDAGSQSAVDLSSPHVGAVSPPAGSGRTLSQRPGTP